MAKYVFPAIFQNEDGKVLVSFPDLPSCFTFGDDLADAIDMAEDALCLLLYYYEKDGDVIPPPSNPMDVKVPEDAFVTLISCDTVFYERYYNNKAVKKTLSIPQWLNERALQSNINFSQVLQNALMEQLNIR